MSANPSQGFEVVEAKLNEFAEKLASLSTSPASSQHGGRSIGLERKRELWTIFQLDHQRSRYIFNEYYKEKSISPALYRWLLRERMANAELIAFWKKPGYERLCCVNCLATKHAVSPSPACICRVPAEQLDPERRGQSCSRCGCRGCHSFRTTTREDSRLKDTATEST